MRDPRFTEARDRKRPNRATLEQIEKARAEGRRVAEGPADATLLEPTRDALVSQPPDYWQAFYDAFVTTVREIPEQQAAWTDALAKAFVTERDAFAISLGGNFDKAQFDGASLDWQEENEPYSVWGRRSPYVSLYRSTFRHRSQLLIRVEPREGLRALDTLPYPGLMMEVLQLYFREDRDLMEELIKAAPPTFDDKGAWRPERSVAALLVMDLVSHHARGLHEVLTNAARVENNEGQKVILEAAPNDAEQRELPSWMTYAFDLVLQRHDGLRIALGYLGHLSREQLRGSELRHDGKEQWTASSAALAALTAALRRASASVRQVREAWEAVEQRAVDKAEKDTKRIRVSRRSSGKTSDREGEGARSLHAEGLPLLLGAAALLGDAPSDAAELELFWTWFEELLERRDPGLSLTTYGTSLEEVPQRFGSLVAQLPFPGKHLRGAYEKLEPQRRRALFAHRHGELPQDLESVVLLRVGLNAAINWLNRVKVGKEADAARELFFWIYAAARRLWLTAVLDTGDTKAQLVTACFAFMPVLFGNALGEALKQALPPLANDARMLADACAMLRLNGVEITKLPALAAGAGVDLMAALRDAHQWSELTGRKEDFPEHLQTLASELGIDFTKPAATPESERGRSLEKAFAEAIPWGAALLHRLEADGCSRIRATPLDQPGHTWVLQATLPEALRDRFGLSPDIRVLAVHGQVRGHDLRHAVEEPEGVADVDPDLLLVAGPNPEFAAKLHRLAGPWGQRVPWTLEGDRFASLPDCLQKHLPAFNLFERRDPVRGRAFIGRRREVDAIAARLLRGQAVGVFGLRKVGKSSLLQAVAEAVDPAGAELAARGGRARVLPDAPAEALVVWLDVQSLVLRTRDAIAERLWEGLKERLDLTGISTTTAPSPGERAPGALAAQVTLREEAPSKDPLDNLRRLLVTALGRREVPPICFILDEYDLLFEGYGGESAVAGVEQIFALLRGLGQTHGRVSLALIGRDPAFADQPHLNGFTNPLLGWVEPFHLGPLSDHDATELLQRLGKRVGLEIGPATVELARRWTGNHPLLLRELGAALYEVARAAHAALPISAEPLRAQAVRVFLQRDAVHTICGEIEALLENRFPEALALLRAIAGAPEEAARGILERHAAAGGKAARVLFDFGLLRGEGEAPWLPLIYRDHFGSVALAPKKLKRSQSHGR